MAVRRTDKALRIIRASRERIWQAWFDPEQLVHWLPPGEMTGRILAFDPVPGGSFGMELSYPTDLEGIGKSGANHDEIGGRFVEIDRPNFFAHEGTFRSDDPAFQGVMRLEWLFEPVSGGTRVTCTARNVPPGISSEDHLAGLSASLAQLAAHVEGRLVGTSLGEKDKR